MKNYNTRELWILKQIYENYQHGVDILNYEFVDDFLTAFPKLKWEAKNWGAHSCPSLGRILKKLYDRNLLKRGTIGLGINWQPGFPRWVWTYALTEQGIKFVEGLKLLEVKDSSPELKLN